MTDKLILILLFCYELLTYLNPSFGAANIKIVYFSILIFLYLFNFKSSLREHNWTIKKDAFFNISFLFLLMFFFRLIFDLYIDDITHKIYENKFTYIFLFINSIILPLFFLRAIKFNKINYRLLYFILTAILFLVLSISFYRLVTQGILIQIGGRTSANENLDPIAYGHLGLTMFILSLANLLNSNKLCLKVLNIFLMVFSLFSIGIANSRSPIVALFFIILFYFIAVRKKKILIIFSILLTVILIFINEINELLQSYGSYFVDRIIQMLNYNSIGDVSSDRSNLIKNGLDNIIDSPIIGSSFLPQSEMHKGIPYHNFVIESFVSLGVLGGGLYLLILFITLYKTYILLRFNKKYYFFSFLFLQYFVYSFFSRSIVSLPLFWFSVFLINYMYSSRRPPKIRVSN
jgi:O-antigen ligase